MQAISTLSFVHLKQMLQDCTACHAQERSILFIQTLHPSCADLISHAWRLHTPAVEHTLVAALLLAWTLGMGARLTLRTAFPPRPCLASNPA